MIEAVPVVVVEIDGARRLWDEAPKAMQQAIELVRPVIEELLVEYGGERIDTLSVDFAVRFSDVFSAVEWALVLDEALPEPASPAELRISAGVDVGVLTTQVAAMSGRAFWIGDVLDSAARLAREAAPGSVRLGPAAVDLLLETCENRDKSWLDRLIVQDSSATIVSQRRPSVAVSKDASGGEDARSNLPDFAGAFVGRVREFNDIARSLPQTRHVALCGPVGAGKSRLAVEFARSWIRESGAERVQAWFCDLSTAHSVGEASFQLARTTGVQIPASEALEELDKRLIASFGERGPLLLLLDDIDTLDRAFIDVVTGWLESAPQLYVLTTRQRRPRVDDESRRAIVTVDALGHHSARALLSDLLDRPLPAAAGSRDPNALVEMVDACGSLPLALELVARSAHRQPGSHPSGEIPPGSDQLERALLRSWQMLDDDQRAALEACTVFADSFSAEAAISVIEAVVGADKDAKELFSVLCQFSLLRSSARPDRVERHVLLAPVGHFVSARSSEALIAKARHRHLLYFAKWARSLKHGLENSQERHWLERVQAELPNLYSAASQGRQTDMSLWISILEALSEVNVRIGPLGGLRERIDEAVERTIEADLPLLELRARRIRGQTLMWTGRYDQAEADYRVVRRLAVDSDDREAAAHALSCYGFAMGLQGKENEGLDKVRQALEDVGQSESFLTIEMLTNAAIVARNRVQIDEATGYLHEALLRARRRQNAFSQASVLFFLGTILRHHHQKWDEAIRYQEEAHDLFSTIGDRRGRLVCYHELAACYTATDQLERAERCYGEATALASMMGDREYSAVFWFGRGRSRFGRADYAGAEPDLLEASLALEEVGHIHLRLATLLYLAATYGALERVSEARAYFEQVETIFDETDITRERPLFEVMYGYLDAALARAAMRSDDDSAARQLLESAYERTTCASGDDEPAQQRVRREAARLLVYLDECVERGELPAGASPRRHVLRVCEEMRWFSVDDDEAVDISRRGPIRRILRALVQRRIDQPGETMTSDEILEAGWPGEVLTAQSASQRLYTTISRMRSLGMQDVLETFDGEYLIAQTYMPVWVKRSG